jgi:hypothetical protein
MEGKDHLEGLGVYMDIILKWFKWIGWEGISWIHLTEDRDKWF